MPKKDPKYGNKHSGKLTYLHFMFYAILRNKDIKITTQNTESYQYRYRKAQLMSFIQDQHFQMEIISNRGGNRQDYSCHFFDIFKSLNTIFTSLTIEETINIIKTYKNPNNNSGE